MKILFFVCMEDELLKLSWKILVKAAVWVGLHCEAIKINTCLILAIFHDTKPYYKPHYKTMRGRQFHGVQQLLKGARG